MSLPTLYEVFNAAGVRLGTSQPEAWSWWPTSKEHNPRGFGVEVAELLVQDLAPYCAGQQASDPNPRFGLSDVWSLRSEGGELTRPEFPEALHNYAEGMDRLSKLPELNPEVPEDLVCIADFRETAAKARELETFFRELPPAFAIWPRIKAP